jgi:hypothetical protein
VREENLKQDSLNQLRSHMSEGGEP